MNIKAMTVPNDCSVAEATRMSPVDFKSTYKAKGWTGRTLAIRWGVSKVANNASRELHWDDAVNGLPMATKD